MSALGAKPRVPRERADPATLARKDRTGPDGREVARERFARAFADVLSGRFGGRWSVEWQRPDRSAISVDRDGPASSRDE